MEEKLKNFVRQIFKGFDTHVFPSLHERKKSILITFFLYFAIAIAVAFIIYEVIQRKYLFLAVDTTLLVVMLVLFYLLKIKNQLKLVIAIFVILICIISTFFTLTGGIESTGVISILLIPIPIILLLGKKKGLFALLFFSITNVGGYLLLRQFELHPAYGAAWIIRISIAFVIISLMALVNEYVFDQLYYRLESITGSFKNSQERYKNLAINKEKFLSLVSHDLSGHMNNFATVSNKLNTKYDKLDDKEKKKLIGKMSIIAEQNSKLLHDLLKWSTVLNESIPYSPKPIKLEKIYREVIDLFNPLIESKKITVFLKMKSNSKVYADNDMLSSVLRNLVSNAIKYSDRGGEISISSTERKNFMLVSVSDKGTGMSEEDLQRLNSFVSFSNPGTIDESGYGIGLILVKEFVQKNRGEFFLKSKIGKGTEASFTIPISE